MRPSVVAVLVALPLALGACGDETATPSAEPTASESTSMSAPADSPSPTAKPVSAQRTCAELYHPPDQLMPRAIELVHGSSSAESADAAAELAAGLAEAEAHALGPLAEDIAVARTGVEAVGAGETPDVMAFDEASNRLGGHCEIYND